MMVRSWVRPWCGEIGVRPGCLDFEVEPWKTIVEFLPLGHSDGFGPLKDVVSIVWYERLLRILPLFVSKNRTQKLINGSYLNNRIACVLESACICIWICIVYVFACITVVIYIIELWLWYAKYPMNSFVKVSLLSLLTITPPRGFFGMTRSEIEAQSPWPLANTLSTSLPKETVTTIMILYKNEKALLSSLDVDTDFFDPVTGV